MRGETGRLRSRLGNGRCNGGMWSAGAWKRILECLTNGKEKLKMPDAELLLRRRIPPEWENRINAIGMAVLLAFMVYVNVMDFVNPAIITLPK